MSKPIVAIVGRPNVGKSTLFNVIAGDSISIVKDTPGVTRDRIYADCTWLDMNFTLIDTGGIEPDSSDVILSQMREQAQIAIDTADVIIFIVDVRQGMYTSFTTWASAIRVPCPRLPGWASAICWTRWRPTSARKSWRTKRTSGPESPLWASPMWASLPLLTA